jgi:DNA-binding transcriptional LysR family regulator
MFRPTQLDLIAKKLGAIPVVCCAHESYLARHGIPEVPEDLVAHDLIGFDRSDLIIAGARQMGFELSRDDFRLRTDSQTEMWELMRAGLGIGFAQQGLVQREPGMRTLLPQLRPLDLEVWLTTHRELFTSRRIRAIYDRLATALVDYLHGLDVTGTRASQ